MRIRGFVTGGVVACALAVNLLATAPASASGRTVVPPGKVLDWSNVFHPLPALPVPKDGVVNGYQFSVRVTGDECAPSVGGPGDQLAAPSGSQVCVFSFDYVSIPSDIVPVVTQNIPGMAAVVDVGSSPVRFSGNDLLDAGTDDFAVDVPNGESATLVLSAAGYSQSFSLSSAQPVGPRPTVLYEPPKARVDHHFLGATFRFTETSGHKRAALAARIVSAQLDWFNPGDPLLHPAKIYDAFLVLGFNETDIRGPTGVSFTEFTTAAPGSDLRLSAAGTTQTAVSTTPGSSGILGLLDVDLYAFTVSADETGGQLRITPGPVVGIEQGNGAPAFDAVEVHFSPATAGTSTTGVAGTSTTTTSAGKRVTTNAIVPTAAAAGGVGGILLLVIFIPIRRRRIGKRTVVRFPRPGPLRPAGTPAPSGPDDHASETREGGDAATPAARDDLEVRLIGPIQAHPVGQTPRRHAVVEAIAYLGMNPEREVPADELRHILGRADKDLAPTALYNILSDLRKAVGKDVLLTVGHAGYRFSGTVTCDWVSLKHLVAARWQTEEERIDNLKEALDLVRGYPFQSPSKARYQWAHDRGYVEEMVTSIDNAAVELCGILQRAGRDTEAFDAAQLGLRAARQSYTLHACRLQAARRDKGRLEQAWRDTVDAVGEVPELRALRNRLLGESS